MRLLMTVLFLLLTASCWAYTVDELVDAIGKAENSKAHPYGIMVKYKHTTPRQACLNTVNHRLYQWNVHMVQHYRYDNDFIVFLGSRYAPIGANNDPQGLNKNWVVNVKYYLEDTK